MRNALLTVLSVLVAMFFCLKQSARISDRKGYTCRAVCSVAELIAKLLFAGDACRAVCSVAELLVQCKSPALSNDAGLSLKDHHTLLSSRGGPWKTNRLSSHGKSKKMLCSNRLNLPAPVSKQSLSRLVCKHTL